MKGFSLSFIFYPIFILSRQFIITFTYSCISSLFTVLILANECLFSLPLPPPVLRGVGLFYFGIPFCEPFLLVALCSFYCCLTDLLWSETYFYLLFQLGFSRYESTSLRLRERMFGFVLVSIDQLDLSKQNKTLYRLLSSIGGTFELIKRDTNVLK